MTEQLNMFGPPPLDESALDDALDRNERGVGILPTQREAANAISGDGQKKFLIIATGLNGAKTKLCHVGSNPEAVAEFARRKRIRVGKRTTKQYLDVQIVELEPQS